MSCKNFLKVHKSTGEKMFAKYLSVDSCFLKSILLTVMMLFPDARTLAFTRQPMKRNFTWSIRAIHLRSSTVLLSRLKFWFAKNWRWTCVLPRQKRVFANYRDHAKNSPCYSKDGANSVLCELHCSHNWSTLLGEKSDYFPIRDY